MQCTVSKIPAMFREMFKHINQVGDTDLWNLMIIIFSNISKTFGELSADTLRGEWQQ